MFETLDIMISLAVVFLILSMVHKYLVSLIKRLLSIKAKVVAEEMETFIGENTVQYLIPYLEKKAKHFNLPEPQHGLRLIRRHNDRQIHVIPAPFAGCSDTFNYYIVDLNQGGNRGKEGRCSF